MVSDLPKSKRATEIISTHRESKTSSLALTLTIDDIHNHTENKENTQRKISMKNIMYEHGKRYS